MKKIFLLLSLLLLLLSSIASAANWQWITSTDTHGFFFDSDTIRYERVNNKPNKSMPIFWLKIVYTPESAVELANEASEERLKETAYSIEKNYLDLQNNRTIYYGGRIFYTESGKVIQQNPPTYIVQEIIPGTVAEVIVFKIGEYCYYHSSEIANRQ